MEDLHSLKNFSSPFSRSFHLPVLLVEFCFNRPKSLSNIFDISKENAICIVFTCDLYEISHEVTIFLP